MQHSNKLINEKSPYLLQHAHNPVNWFPWCDEAFEKAKEEDKPVFLSIGYSTCHWCHVMEKESFEDEGVAKLMNEIFISIKVDREERPDIDGVYMSVCQMMTGGGGWPLTIIMTPDKKPFFTGTYFPKDGKYGRMGMMELVPRINEIWKTKRDEINSAAENIIEGLKSNDLQTNDEDLTVDVFKKAFGDLSARYDEKHGGFGNAPKFPSPHNLLFLLRYWKEFDQSFALEMVKATLKEMRKGGIYDQLGKGFARYSTDKEWFVPHFEKMLCDQAMLLMVYTETYLATKDEFFKETGEEIIEYVLREMRDEKGGFYSAEDADSEGEEGKFYVWTTEELKSVLTNDEFDLAVKLYNIEEDGNWFDESKGMKNRTNILHLKHLPSELHEAAGMSKEKFNSIWSSLNEKLFKEREKRVHPYKDDKILTDWNALMITAIAKAGEAFGNDNYTSAAVKSFEFINNYLTDEKGFLLHRYREGEAGLTAHLDDYAFLINASMDLYEATTEINYLHKALKFYDITSAHFKDDKNGGYFFTGDFAEKILTRQKELYDGAIPSGNSAMLLASARLWKLTGDHKYQKNAEELIAKFSAMVNRSPSAFSYFLTGFFLLAGESYEIVLSGKTQSDNFKEIFLSLRSVYLPNKVILFKDENPDIIEIAPFTRDMIFNENDMNIYICKEFSCEMPVKNVKEMMGILKVK